MEQWWPFFLRANSAGIFKNLPAMCEIWRSTEVFQRAYHSSHHNLIFCMVSYTRQLQSTVAPQWMSRNSSTNPPSLDKTKENVYGSLGYLSFVALLFTHLWATVCLRHWVQYLLPHSLFFSTGAAAHYGLYFAAFYRTLSSSRTRFLDHTQRSATVGRTPLNEWSVRRRELYLTTHNTHNRQTSLLWVVFDPTITAGEWP
jgi:hypothetical protein